MKNWLKTRYEVLLIEVARKILIDRNVQRSAIVSRKDNDEMWGMAEKLEVIETRMLTKYQ